MSVRAVRLLAARRSRLPSSWIVRARKRRRTECARDDRSRDTGTQQRFVPGRFTERRRRAPRRAFFGRRPRHDLDALQNSPRAGAPALVRCGTVRACAVSFPRTAPVIPAYKSRNRGSTLVSGVGKVNDPDYRHTLERWLLRTIIEELGYYCLPVLLYEKIEPFVLHFFG